MQKRDSKSFDTGSLQTRYKIDEPTTVAAIHQSCDNGFFGDKKSLADANQRIDATDNRFNGQDANNAEVDQPNEVSGCE